MSALEHKLAALRTILQARGAQGFLLPVGDEFLGEYVPEASQRLAWLTGFTGSAGMALVLPARAGLFVDGRYTLQARQEVPGMEHFNSGDKRPEAWLAEHMQPGQHLGYDPWLLSQREVERLEKALTPKGIALLALSPNPVDALWIDRPAAPAGPVHIHPLEYAGEAHAAKRARVGEAIRAAGAEVAVLAATDSINWLLNIRGRDVPFSPLALAYALLETSGRATLYIAPERVDAAVLAHLAADVTMRAPSHLAEDMAALGAAKKRVLADASLTPAWFVSTLRAGGATVLLADDPCQKPKAIKNPVELAGMRAAHVRDGLALTRFLCWLEHEAATRTVTECEVMERLRAHRACAPEFVSPSFETIAGSGPNGAIVHYRATEASNRTLRNGELFLLDSGGQYPDGTTDVTRTLAVGTPLPEHRTRFTQVLKGHIALATVRFPEGTTGSQLDVLARHALWQEGLDYDHGTGHGVGAFLNVHEGPQRISKRGGDAQALAPGMIVSNEPGYYKEGAYGIRIESLVAVVHAGSMENGKAQLAFETLTCVPVDLRLVDSALLTPAEKDWLNHYHAWVRATHAPQMTEEEIAWLTNATRALG